MKTREGNEVYPAGCALRESIRGNSNSICADCVHVADMCRGINKASQTVNGYTGVIRCDGFQPVDEVAK